jgi:hypothetical protein
MIMKKHHLIAVVVVAMLVLSALACTSTEQAGDPTVGVQPQPPSTGGADGEVPTSTSAEQAQPASGVLDPCTLLTQQEAEALFGTTSQPGVPSEVTTGMVTTYSCSYLSTDNLNALFVGAAWIEGGAANSIGFTSVTEGGQVVTVNGAEAVFTSDLMYIAKGNWLGRINGMLGGSIATAEQLTPLVQTVADRLP